MSKGSYQKLKEENAMLRKDIYKLVMESHNMNGQIVKTLWTFRFKAERELLKGHASNNMKQ
jgi:hypothetical protein